MSDRSKENVPVKREPPDDLGERSRGGVPCMGGVLKTPRDLSTQKLGEENEWGKDVFITN